MRCVSSIDKFEDLAHKTIKNQHMIQMIINRTVFKKIKKLFAALAYLF